jgi:4-hydroxy-tetrahydrodipicolinate reductase
MAHRLLVLGPSGKMGAAVIAAASDEPSLELTAAVDRESAAGVGAPAPIAMHVTVTSDVAAAMHHVDVYIDFTSPDATEAAARAAAAHKVPAVIGTTGLDPSAARAIAELAKVAPVVVAANFSLGVNLLIGLARTAARTLPAAGWDAEVAEIHHHAKRDAPSGTAIAIARAIADARGQDYAQVARHARDGQVGARPEGEIGVVALRGGDVVGEHTAFFFGPHERVELTHRATSRAIFAQGAVRAAAWVVGRAPGRYDMLDVLGLS